MQESQHPKSRPGIRFLLLTHWKGYLWRVLLAAMAVLSVGLIQHLVVLDIPLEEIHPRILMIPTLVGGIFGFLLTTVRLMQHDQRHQINELVEKDAALVAEMRRRETADQRGQRFNYAILGSDDGLWDWDIKTGEVYYSPRWESMLGYEPGEVPTHVDFWRNALHPEDLSETFGILEQHLAGKIPQFRSEMRLRTKKGEWCWVFGRGQVVEFDDEGAPIRAVGTMTDISDRKRIEEALQLLLSSTAGDLGDAFSQHLVRSLSEVLNVRFTLLATVDPVIPARINTVATWDTQLSERMASCLVTDTPCEEVIKEGYFVIPAGLRTRYSENEMINRLKGESYQGAALYDQSGSVVGLIAMVDDVELPQWKIQLGRTILPIFAARASAEIERRQVQNELVRQKERAQVTLHSIGDAVITTDYEGYVEYMNPVAEAITGWRADAAIGMHLNEVCVAVDLEGVTVANAALETCLKSASTLAGVCNIRLRTREGDIVETEQTASPIKDKHDALLGAVVVFRDVSSTREMARQMSWQARHDALTNLVNRREFEHRLTQMIDEAVQEHQNHAVLYIDLDQFKVVNDTCGHFAGDDLLRQITAVLKVNVRQSDTLARLGGDEFGVLLHGCDNDVARKMARKLVDIVQEYRFVWEDRIFHIGASIGVVNIDADTEGVTAVMKAADMACYAAKEGGRNRIYVYEADDEVVALRQVEMHWVSRIKEAIEHQDIVLYGQRILSLKDTGADHYEILSRMRQPDGTIIPPGSFIPAAERYNIAVDIDRYVIGMVFDYIQRGVVPANVVLAINLSGNSLSDEGLLSFILHSAETMKIYPASICFEITETAAIANMTHASAFISGLHDAGFLFALDDFGSGLSSFGYLKKLSVDFLKIDGSFVKDMVSDPIDAAMVSAINEIGHRMNKATIAEFVEDADILEALKSMGVDFAQGYHIHKPEPLEDILSEMVSSRS